MIICLIFALSFAFTTVHLCLTWTKNQSLKILSQFSPRKSSYCRHLPTVTIQYNIKSNNYCFRMNTYRFITYYLVIVKYILHATERYKW